MADLGSANHTDPSETPWEWLVVAARDHLNLTLSQDVVSKIRKAFFDIANCDQDDLAQSIFLEVLVHRKDTGNIEETDFLRASWRVSKRILRDVHHSRRLITEFAENHAVGRSKSDLEATIELKEVLEFAEALDPVAALILMMSHEGATLADISDHIGIPITTLHDRKANLLKRLKHHFR